MDLLALSTFGPCHAILTDPIDLFFSDRMSLLVPDSVNDDICITKPYDYVVQHDLRIFQRAACALIKAKTSGLLYKGVKIITNLLNCISDLVIMQNIKDFLLVYVYPLHFLNLKTQIFSVDSDFWSPLYVHFICVSSSVCAALSVWLQI